MTLTTYDVEKLARMIHDQKLAKGQQMALIERCNPPERALACTPAPVPVRTSGAAAK